MSFRLSSQSSTEQQNKNGNSLCLMDNWDKPGSALNMDIYQLIAYLSKTGWVVSYCNCHLQ